MRPSPVSRVLATTDPSHASAMQAMAVTTGVACTVYLALLPTNDATFVRSAALFVAGLSAVAETCVGWRAGARPPSPGGQVLWAMLAWGGWTLATWFWSINPGYTLDQLEREALQTGVAIFAFHVASRDDRSFRVLAGTAIGSFVFFAAFAVGMALTAEGWQPAPWHYDFGIWSTYVVLVAPLLLMVLIPAPFGFGDGIRGLVVAALLVALLVTTLLITQNRIAWPTLAISLGIAAAAIRARFRDTPRRVVLRWFLPVAAVLVVLVIAFVDASRDRAHRLYPGMSVLYTFEIDPRLALWKLALRRIGEHPVLGYGFGRRILGDQLVAETGNELMNHPHNLFLSIWLQTGVIGLVLFCALLAALCRRYLAFVRADDRRLAITGILGIAIVAGFVIKNQTDDFFYRSNAKEFFVLNAMLIGYGARLLRPTRRDPPSRVRNLPGAPGGATDDDCI